MNADTQASAGFTVGQNLLAGKLVLSPSASLTYATCSAMRAAFEKASSGHNPTVILDCRAVAFMDSEALELLVETHDKLLELRGELRLTHVNAVCADILTATRLVHLFMVYGDINQALKGG